MLNATICKQQRQNRKHSKVQTLCRLILYFMCIWCQLWTVFNIVLEHPKLIDPNHPDMQSNFSCPEGPLRAPGSGGCRSQPNLALVFCVNFVLRYVLLWMHVCLSLCLFSFFSTKPRLAGKNVSEVTYFVLGGPLNLNSIIQSCPEAYIKIS